jgi:uncharacterized repeat protein (TIGR03803 family)
MMIVLGISAPSPAQQYSVLHKFTGGVDGSLPGAIVLDPAGNLYGVAALGGNLRCGWPGGCGTVFKLDQGGHMTVLQRFEGPDGIGPSGILRDRLGNLYGATTDGGAHGYGVVFKMDLAGHFTVLFNFGTGDVGANPSGALVLDNAGNLYGTTVGGGSTGFGVVFRLDPAGNEEVLHTFGGAPVDGAGPLGTLTRDGDGNLYGTTSGGGPDYDGIAYKLDAAGNETVLHNFTGGADGWFPSSGLIRDAAGNLYGTTENGGSSSCAPLGCGIVFKLTPEGVETVLHAFQGYPTDGQEPLDGLLADGQGNLYGTTFSGGTRQLCGPIPAPCGTIFRLSPIGEESILHDFTPASGILPYAGLIGSA